MISRVRSLLHVIGSGKRLTRANHLGLAEAKALANKIGKGDEFDPVIGPKVWRTKSSREVPSVELTFRWARAAGFVRVIHGQVKPTRKASALGRRPLEDWWDLFVSFVRELEWPRRRYPDHLVPLWSKEVSEIIPSFLEEVYREGGRPLSVSRLSEATWNYLGGIFDLRSLSDVESRSWPMFLEGDLWLGVFEPLELLGALRREETPERTVRATPLGLWATRRLIATTKGFEPPLAGDLAERSTSAESLLSLAAEQRVELAEITEEARRYGERRGAREAATELVELLAQAGPRILAVRAALEAFPPGTVAPLVRAALDRGASGPGAVECAAWLTDHGLPAPRVHATLEQVAESTAWHLVAVARAEGTEHVPEVLSVVEEEAQLAVIEAMRKSESPYAEEALEAVADAATGARVRKEAQRALHQWRAGRQ